MEKEFELVNNFWEEYDPPESLNLIALKIKDWRESKEFITPPNIINPQNKDMMLGKLMLVVSEISEAAEAIRIGDRENFIEELADTMIRILDICGTCGIDPGQAIFNRMKVNVDRPNKHCKGANL